MHSPKTLTGEALAFWKAHAPGLKKARKLTQNSVYSFVLLCQTWDQLQQLVATVPGADHYREMGQLHALRKDYFQLAREFGLLPLRPKASDDEPDDEEADKFGL